MTTRTQKNEMRKMYEDQLLVVCSLIDDMYQAGDGEFWQVIVYAAKHFDAYLHMTPHDIAEWMGIPQDDWGTERD